MSTVVRIAEDMGMVIGLALIAGGLIIGGYVICRWGRPG
jgi:hypothetical protein